MAGALALLYGLTPTQIVQLTVADIEQRDDHTFLRLGRSPMVLPDSLASIIVELAEHATAYRHSIVATTPTRSPWLFPGGAPGHHARASWISDHLGVSDSVLSKQLAHLVEAGYVAQRRGPQGLAPPCLVATDRPWSHGIPAATHRPQGRPRLPACGTGRARLARATALRTSG